MRCVARALTVFSFVCLVSFSADGQTTQGLIRGQVVAASNGEPLDGAAVAFTNRSTNQRGHAETDSVGRYTLPLLPPAVYTLRVTASGYQAR